MSMLEKHKSGEALQGELFPNLFSVRESVAQTLASYPDFAVSPDTIDDLYESLEGPTLLPSHSIHTDEDISSMLGEVFHHIDDEVLQKLLDIRDYPSELRKIVMHLYSPVVSLGGKSPISLLLEEGGKEKLLRHLGQLECGIYV